MFKVNLFDDAIPTLSALAGQEIPQAICSNLAKPYGIVIERLLTQFNFIECLSYSVGAVKSDKEIYNSIVSSSVAVSWLGTHGVLTALSCPASRKALYVDNLRQCSGHDEPTMGNSGASLPERIQNIRPDTALLSAAPIYRSCFSIRQG